MLVLFLCCSYCGCFFCVHLAFRLLQAENLQPQDGYCSQMIGWLWTEYHDFVLQYFVCWHFSWQCADVRYARYTGVCQSCCLNDRNLAVYQVYAQVHIEKEDRKRLNSPCRRYVFERFFHDFHVKTCILICKTIYIYIYGIWEYGISSCVKACWDVKGWCSWHWWWIPVLEASRSSRFIYESRLSVVGHTSCPAHTSEDVQKYALHSWSWPIS